jgi:hypothetical protein
MAYWVVVATLGTDPVVAFESHLVVRMTALLTFYPDALGDFAFDTGRQPALHFFKPIHLSPLDQTMPRRRRLASVMPAVTRMPAAAKAAGARWRRVF